MEVLTLSGAEVGISDGSTRQAHLDANPDRFT